MGHCASAGGGQEQLGGSPPLPPKPAPSFKVLLCKINTLPTKGPLSQLSGLQQPEELVPAEGLVLELPTMHC